MKITKKLFALVAALATAAVLAVCASAETVLPYDPGIERVGENGRLPEWYPADVDSFRFYHDDDAPRVVDGADLFDPSEEKALEELLLGIRAEIGRDLVICTDVSDYGLGKDIFAADFYDFNGYGCGDEREGACLFIDMDPEDRGGWTCCTGSDTIGLYTEEVANLIDDDLYWFLGEGEYYDGVCAWIDDFYNLYLKGDPFLDWLPDRGETFTRFRDESAPRVIDLTDSLSSGELEELSASAAELSDKYGIDVVALVTGFTSSLDLREYAEKYYEYNGYGLGDDYRGIMLAVLKNGSYVETEILTFGGGVRTSDKAEDRMRDHFSDTVGSKGLAEALQNWIGEADHLQKTGRVPRTFGSWAGTAGLGAIAGAIVGFFGLSGAKKKMATPKIRVDADAYVVAETLAVANVGDHLINRTTSRVYAPVQSSSSGSGSSGGSSYSGSYSGSSGSSHSGSGRSF